MPDRSTGGSGGAGATGDRSTGGPGGAESTGDRSTGTGPQTEWRRAVVGSKRAVANAPVLAFVLLTFTYTWTIDGITLIAFESPSELHGLPRVWGPLVAAVVVVWTLDGDVRSFVGHVRNVRVGVRWYALAFALPPVLTDVEALLSLGLGADVGFEPTAPLALYLLNFLLVLFLAGGLEEFGWRGFAQSRLQGPHGALAAAIVVGLLWSSWHLPLFLWYELAAYDPATLHVYYLTTVAQSVVFAWLYNSTDGGLLVVMIAHAAGNLPPFLVVTGETPGLVATLPVRELTYVAVALVVVVYAGSRTLSRDDELPPVAGLRTTDAD